MGQIAGGGGGGEFTPAPNPHTVVRLLRPLLEPPSLKFSIRPSSGHSHLPGQGVLWALRFGGMTYFLVKNVFVSTDSTVFLVSTIRERLLSHGIELYERKFNRSQTQSILNLSDHQQKRPAEMVFFLKFQAFCESATRAVILLIAKSQGKKHVNIYPLGKLQ